LSEVVAKEPQMLSLLTQAKVFQNILISPN